MYILYHKLCVHYVIIVLYLNNYIVAGVPYKAMTSVFIPSHYPMSLHVKHNYFVVHTMSYSFTLV